jgi:hypothetical protein
MKDSNGTPIQAGQHVREDFTGYEYDVTSVSPDGVSLRLADPEYEGLSWGTFLPSGMGEFLTVWSDEEQS